MSSNFRRPVLLAGLLAVFLNLAFAFQFVVDPLGLSPVLDARENMAWAAQIARGDLPDEPFFRALFYPAILALLAKAGLLSAATATALGVGCHLLNTLLAALISSRIWKSHAAGWFSGLLYAIYPVGMWFAVQTLDISFGITLFLLAVWLLLRACDTEAAHSPRYGGLVIAGFVGGLAVLARPNFLPAVVMLPILPVLLLWQKGMLFSKLKTFAAPVLVTGSGLLVALMIQGCINYRISGEFRILPWQGAYNLYAGNHAGANGKYLKQKVSFADVPAGMNPARMESEYLYRTAVGEEADLSIDAMNAYWKERLLDEVLDDPARWLGLMGRKVVYLLNDWEQYNNLSYAYHKARFSFLSYNPLGWGCLLLASLGGLLFGWRHLDRSRGFALALLLLGYAAGVLLFFVSARFRLPLAPLLCVFSGGCVWFSLSRVRELGAGRLAMACMGGLLIAIVSYGNWFEAKDRSPFIQDELLLAIASQNAGMDRIALQYADAVLARDSAREEARRIQVSALFNLWLVAADADSPEALWSDLEAAIAELSAWDASTLFIRGVVLWRSRGQAQARDVWLEGLTRYGTDARACAQALQVIGAAQYFEPDDPGLATIRAILER